VQSIEGVAEEICRYCARHPGARDSLEGIAWWIAADETAITRDQLRAAVDVLVARGVLAAHRLRDGSIVFGCSQLSEAKGSQ